MKAYRKRPKVSKVLCSFYKLFIKKFLREKIGESKNLLFKSVAEACFPYRDRLQEALVDKEKDTILHLVYEKRNQKEPCFMMEWAMKPLEFAKLKKDFFIPHLRIFMSFLRYFNLAYHRDIFISPPFLTRPLVYFLSKSSKRMNRQVRRVFNKYVNIVLEKGFVTKSIIDFQQVIDDNYPSFKSTFYTKQEYVDFNTHHIEAVTMDEFR